MGVARNLAGQRFGKLTVQYATEKRADQGSIVWHCVCDCGNTCQVSARRLTRGKVRSCGCLSSSGLKDYIGKTFGRLTVTEYMGTAKELSHTGTVRYWKCLCACGKETVVRQTELQNGESQSCGCLQKEHARNVLRLVEGTSVAVLERNKTGMRADNTSGKTGVWYNSRHQSWDAYITFKKKRYWLGHYKNKADAIRVRTEAETMYEDFLKWYYEVSPSDKKNTGEQE